MVFGTHNVIHLRITNNTALRVVVYLPKEKVDWYNENHLHPLVLEALYPIIVENLVKDQEKSRNKRKKESETNQSVDMDGFRLLYRFVPHKTHSKMITTERDFQFQEQDEKPILKTNYKAISVYPFQLLVSIDDQLFINRVNTLDSYFTSMAFN